ncbi:MAG: cation:proton antiporter [Bacteroidales bacterium]
MEISFVIVFLGLLIFFAHLSNELFNKTKIPNVLLLLLIGIILGPVTGIVHISFFGEVGRIFTTITLIIILFESGISLKFSELRQSIGPATFITLFNFIGSAAIVTVLAHLLGGIDWISSLYMGSVVGGISSAVVIPMVRQLSIGEESKVILYLESVLSDVLCLVVALALLEGMQEGVINIGGVFSNMWKSFLFAGVFGILGGTFWSVLLKNVRSIKNSMFTTLAFVFILYGFVESMGFNGGIATLMFGIMLGNSEAINDNKIFRRVFIIQTTNLTDHERNFFGEIVFIVQTYFFVFIGISIQFGNLWTYLIGLLAVGLILLYRPLVTKIFAPRGMGFRDMTTLSIMAPKGLITAVLSSIPLQMGIFHGEWIQDLGYSIVLFSIIISSGLVIAFSNDPLFFTRMYKRNKNQKPLKYNIEPPISDSGKDERGLKPE